MPIENADLIRRLKLAGLIGGVAAVTIVGWGRELPGKAGKLIQIRKITSITRNAASQPATANP